MSKQPQEEDTQEEDNINIVECLDAIQRDILELNEKLKLLEDTFKSYGMRVKEDI